MGLGMTCRSHVRTACLSAHWQSARTNSVLQCRAACPRGFMRIKTSKLAIFAPFCAFFLNFWHNTAQILDSHYLFYTYRKIRHFSICCLCKAICGWAMSSISRQKLLKGVRVPQFYGFQLVCV